MVYIWNTITNATVGSVKLEFAGSGIVISDSDGDCGRFNINDAGAVDEPLKLTCTASVGDPVTVTILYDEL